MKKCLTAVATAAAALASGSAFGADGKLVYAQACAHCHATGLAGAPKTGDRNAWAPRIGAGRETMLAAVMKGRGAMPPKGGNASLSDAEAKAAVAFMLDQVK